MYDFFISETTSIDFSSNDFSGDFYWSVCCGVASGVASVTDGCMDTNPSLDDFSSSGYSLVSESTF